MENKLVSVGVGMNFMNWFMVTVAQLRVRNESIAGVVWSVPESRNDKRSHCLLQARWTPAAAGPLMTSLSHAESII